MIESKIIPIYELSNYDKFDIISIYPSVPESMVWIHYRTPKANKDLQNSSVSPVQQLKSAISLVQPLREQLLRHDWRNGLECLNRLENELLGKTADID